MGKGNVEQLSLYLQNEFPAIFGFVLWRHHVETVKDAYYFGFVSLSVGYDEEELEDALEQNITCFKLCCYVVVGPLNIQFILKCMLTNTKRSDKL